MNIDFRLKHVPSVVINFFSRVFAYYTIKRISHHAKDLSGTIHAKRMEENKRLYEYLESRLQHSVEE
jgi:hypothetical protein